MGVLVYERRSISKDALISVIGVGLTSAALIGLELVVWLAWGCALLLSVFIGFAWLTLIRARTRISIDDERIAITHRISGRPQTIRWDELSGFRLRYFSTRSHREGRQDRERGWWQLTLRSAGATINVDSNLERFDMVLESALRHARRQQIEMDGPTCINLEQLGLGG